jgi:hypothetical protein
MCSYRQVQKPFLLPVVCRHRGLPNPFLSEILPRRFVTATRAKGEHVTEL